MVDAIRSRQVKQPTIKKPIYVCRHCLAAIFPQETPLKFNLRYRKKDPCDVCEFETDDGVVIKR